MKGNVMFSDEFVNVMKRLVLESENLIERLEEDTDSDLRWGDEKISLVETINEAREALWGVPAEEEEYLEEEKI